jgi:PAS domain S-box-containing protein
MNIGDQRPREEQTGKLEFWQLLADNMPQLAWVADDTGYIYWYNRRWFEFTGTTIEDMRGWGWQKVHHPDHVEPVTAAFAAAIETGVPYEGKFPLRGKDGSYRWFLTRAEPIRDIEGRISHWFGTNTDISETLDAQQAMRSAQHRLKRATSVIGLFVWETDLRTHVTSWADNSAEVLGVAEADLPTGPRNGLFFVGDAERGRVEAHLAAATAARESQAAVDFVGADGRHWRAECAIEYDPAGSAVHLFGATQDVTLLEVARRRDAFLLRLEQELRAAPTTEGAMVAAAKLLATSIDASRVAYAEVDAITGKYNITAEYHEDDLVSSLGAHTLDPNDPVFAAYRAGEQFVVADHRNDPRTRHYRDVPEIAALQIGAVLDTPVIREGRVVGTLLVHDRTARNWTSAEMELVRATADRTWADVERARAEEGRRLSEQRFQTIFEQAAVGVARVSPDGPFLEINDRFCDILGRDRSELIGSPWTAITHPDDVDADLASLNRVMRGEIGSYSMEKRYLAKDGRSIWVELNVSAERDANGAVLFLIPVVQDIGDRKDTEAALRTSQERLSALFESMDQGFCLLELVVDDSDKAVDYRFLQTNPAFERQSSLILAEGRTILEMVPDLDRLWIERYARIAASHKAERFIDHAEPLHRWFECYAFPIGDLALKQVAVLFTDITERREREELLRASEARLRAVIDAAPVGLVFADADGRITGGNSRVEWLVGHPVLPSPDLESYGEWISFHLDGRQVQSHEYPLARVLRGADFAEMEVLYQRGDGRLSWIRFNAAAIKDAAGNTVGGVVASTDIDREKRLTESLEQEVEKVIAEREQAQDALRQSQKLEAMGQLTGGVAHDFNNLLTPIIGSLDLLQRRQLGDARTRRLVDGALQSAERAKLLVQRLLAFARRQPLQPTAVDVGAVVTNMVDLIGSTSGPRVRVHVDVEPDLPAALADSNQLEMALLNLSVNARDAMPEGGTLGIVVHRADPGKALPVGLRDEEHVVLSVSDSGTGMDAETIRRCIEPFFSTKGVGKGTGLGLSMVHGLAAQLGGALDIRSEPGLGTTIALWLPVAEQKQEQETPTVLPTAAGSPTLGRVLLVDDEELVRAATGSMLRDLGYDVGEAGSAEEALRAILTDGPPDLLITDQLMPGMTGTQFALMLREAHPRLPVLIVSGYASADSLSDDFAHLSKPFRQSELVTALAELR